MSSRFSWIVFSFCLTASVNAGLAIAKPAPDLAVDAVVTTGSDTNSSSAQTESPSLPTDAVMAIAPTRPADTTTGRTTDDSMAIAAAAKLPRKARYRVVEATAPDHAILAGTVSPAGATIAATTASPDPVVPDPIALAETEVEAAPSTPTAAAAIAQADSEVTSDMEADSDATAGDELPAEATEIFDVTVPSPEQLDGESRQIVESMRANPNPLLYPTATEEVEIIGGQPLTLEQAYAIAAQNNRDLQVVLLQLEQSRLALREQEAQNWPDLAVSGGLTGTENNQDDIEGNPFFGQEPFEFDDVNLDLAGTVRLSYDVFTAGRRPALIEAAERQLRATELEVERLQEDVRQEVATAYYGLQEADESVRISSAFLEQARRSQRDAQIREEAGVGTTFDVLQADVEVAIAEQNLVNAQSQQVISRRQLASILNVPHTVTLQATEVEPPEIAWPLSLEESLILAFQNRAELEQFLISRELGEQQRRIALSTTGPQVQVFAQYSVNDSLNNNSPGSQDFIDQYQFGAQFNWTLFDGGEARAAAAQSVKDIEIAETQFAQTLYAIRFQVEQSYYTQASQFANIRTAELGVTQATRALEIARLRFQAGVGTQLEVLQAQSNLTEAEGNYITAIVGYNRAIADLRRSISNLPEGRLLPSLEIPPASRFTVPVSLDDYEELIDRLN